MPDTEKKKFILSHQGEINYDNIGVLLTELKKSMELHGFKVGTYKKVLAVMVECLENIYKYLDNKKSAILSSQKQVPFFKLEFIDGEFILKAGNPLLKEDIENLEKKLKKINGLDEEGLKKMYKKIITDGKFTEKGGAGLGFVEMVKTTGNKIDFSFKEINPEVSYFNIQLKIPVTN